MADILARLPNVPVPFEVGLVISALLVSLTVALITLLRGRHLLAAGEDLTADMGVIFENPSSLMPHVIELRQRLIRSFIAVAVGTAVAGAITAQILAALAVPIGGMDQLQAIGVTEPFGVTFRVALTVGFILAAPYIIAQVWLFVAAGLKPSERRMFYLFVPFAVLLFLVGVGFAYFVMLPTAVPFLVNFMNINATPTPENYIKFVTSVLLWVGVSFEMPLVTFILAKLGVVTGPMLAKNWRIAIVVIAILSAVITPTPDPVNMGIVAAPLLVLYVLSILLAFLA